MVLGLFVLYMAVQERWKAYEN